MKVLKIIIKVILILFIFSSCSKTEYEKKRDLENKIIGKTWKELEKEKNLIPFGEGKSITPGKEFVRLYFQYFNPLTIDEARKLVIFAAKTFLHNLNSDEKLNELIDKPYPMEWIQITIYVYNPDYSDIEPPGISIVRLGRDSITYLYLIEENKKKDLKTIQEETYEEALEKLKDNKEGVVTPPAAYIDENICNSRTHFVSRDFVPYFDLKGYLRNKDSVVKIKAHPDAKFIDHSFNSPSYNDILSNRIEKYIK